MVHGMNAETRFWIRLAAFARLSEYVLGSGAGRDDAEELLFGWSLPGDLPVGYACLGGGLANRSIGI